MKKRTDRMMGLSKIMVERLRQVSDEGYDARHDDAHDPGELAAAAIAYNLKALQQICVSAGNGPPVELFDLIEEIWPWSEEFWKPDDDPIRNMVKAGALIAAEIDRQLRNGK